MAAGWLGLQGAGGRKGQEGRKAGLLLDDGKGVGPDARLRSCVRRGAEGVAGSCGGGAGAKHPLEADYLYPGIHVRNSCPVRGHQHAVRGNVQQAHS